MEYSLEKIAKKFNISKTAVSLILNGKASRNRISPELEQSVKDFCESVNYRPNIHARRMCSKIVRNVGLLINKSMLSDCENPFSDQVISEITGGMVLAAEERNFRVTIQLYDSGMDANVMFEWLRNKEIDGLIYYGYTVDGEWLKSFLSEKRHIVGIGIPPTDGITSVNIDNRRVMKNLTDLIAEKGRKRFAYLSGVKGYVSSERFLGMLDSLKQNGIPFDEDKIIYGDYSEKKAYELIRKIDIDFDALVCANDDMAAGALRALKEKGIRIPEQVSVAGADNIRISACTEPKIATIDNMNTQLGKTAVYELIKLIDGQEPKSVFLKSRVIKNNSI